ncbi:MAG: hypothetical protein QGD96_11730 [Anaerolineae bacterium]|nr:hypothetical protein [Anaerolineae bacterium]
MRLTQLRTRFGFQTTSLFILDGLANVIDFGFHFWMGRVLIPADFAILQTLNSVLLVYITASSVFQPVVSRFVTEARGKGTEDSIPGIFQSFLRAALWLGVGLAILIYLFSTQIAQTLNLPTWTVQISVGLIFLSTLRPIALGLLQGAERFIPYGFARFATALGRLLISIILIAFGFGLQGALVGFLVGWLIGVVTAFLFLTKNMWIKTKPLESGYLRKGLRLSGYALLAYIAFMSLTSIDLIWVQRNLSGDLAGAYASLVVLRRAVALLPGVAVVVMFPRIVKHLAAGQLPDRTLIKTAGFIFAAGGAMTFLFFVFDEELILLIFGGAYLVASPLLGWMGFGMIGFSLSAIWLNFYLAHKPRNFVILLVMALGLEWLLLTHSQPSMANALIVFALTSWLLSFAGLLLYLFKNRNEIIYA